MLKKSQFGFNLNLKDVLWMGDGMGVGGLKAVLRIAYDNKKSEIIKSKRKLIILQ